jgi:hypothetical protein
MYLIWIIIYALFLIPPGTIIDNNIIFCSTLSEFSPVWTDFDKCHNLSKRNVKLILKIQSHLEPLRASSNKKRIQLVRV